MRQKERKRLPKHRSSSCNLTLDYLNLSYGFISMFSHNSDMSKIDLLDFSCFGYTILNVSMAQKASNHVEQWISG